MSGASSDVQSRFTKYNGRMYRSRTEAVWAATFDALGIEFKYEPITFKTPHGQYVPDFLTRSAWVEIKGSQGPDDDAAARIEFTAGAQKRPFFVFCGRPDFRVFSDGVDMCNFGIYRATGRRWNNMIPGPRLEIVQTVGGVELTTGEERRLSIYRVRRAVAAVLNPMIQTMEECVAQCRQSTGGWSRMEADSDGDRRHP